MLVKQCTDLPLSKLLSKTCTGYAKYFNLKYGRIGQVFQDQFKAIAVDSNEYLVWLSAYIHSNPIVSGLVENSEDWQWSSYAEYLGSEWGVLCDKSLVRQQFQSVEDYKKFVLECTVLIREKKEMERLLLD